ncbi:MAG: radical SAM family heme chaperone HemW [Bacteroidia bacterium]
MPGIYIHIPFCKKACHYCDFHFSTSLRNKEALVEALCTEIETRKDYPGTKELSSVYFGGGTPSLLSKTDIEKLFNTIGKHFTIANDAEITLEANPDDLTATKTAELKASGINRLSIGIQSFHDEHLKLMNRSHSSLQAVEAVKHAKKSGIDNISIDLIYGLPDLSQEKWKYNLSHAFALDVPHLSAYCLTVEKKTALNHFIQNNTITLPEEAEVLKQFNMLMEQSAKHGFIHYEISNFCREGMHAKHNSSYWKNEPYLGIGPSAHSYNGKTRQWNIANNALYLKGLQANEPVFEMETLSEADKFNEYVMTRLRTIWGIDLVYAKSAFGERTAKGLLQESGKYINSGCMKQNGEIITLTQKGKFIADKIASDLFI